MSHTATLWRSFPENGPERRFRLPIGALLELQERTGLAPEQLVDKLVGRATEDEPDELVLLAGLAEQLRDDSETIALAALVVQTALQWGGLSHAEAFDLTNRYCRERKSFETYPLAIEILKAALTAPADDPFPKYPRKGGKAASEDDSSISAASSYFRFCGGTGLDPQTVMQLSVWQYAQVAYGRYMANVVLDENTFTAEEDALLDELLGIKG